MREMRRERKNRVWGGWRWGGKEEKSCARESREALTLFDALESDGLLAVLDHGVHVPGGESGHGGVVDFQQEFVRPEFAAVAARRGARGKLADDRELSILRAALQLQPQRPFLAPAEDALVDFVGPVVPPLLQALGHDSRGSRGWGEEEAAAVVAGMGGLESRRN